MKLLSFLLYALRKLDPDPIVLLTILNIEIGVVIKIILRLIKFPSFFDLINGVLDVFLIVFCEKLDQWVFLLIDGDFLSINASFLDDIQFVFDQRVDFFVVFDSKLLRFNAFFWQLNESSGFGGRVGLFLLIKVISALISRTTLLRVKRSGRPTHRTPKSACF